MSNPQTFAEWWSYIKTDSDTLRTRYFLRNWSAISHGIGGVEGLIAFLGTVVPLKCHRTYGEAPVGNYSIQLPDRVFSFRVDPTTPTVTGPKGYPSVCVTHDYAPAPSPAV